MASYQKGIFIKNFGEPFLQKDVLPKMHLPCIWVLQIDYGSCWRNIMSVRDEGLGLAAVCKQV
jgi:hypothetical protein